MPTPDTKPMMACGCAANATTRIGEQSIPCCAIHECMEQRPTPDLSGRRARCAYGEHAIKPSSADLPFFEYQGPGSREATDYCKCGYAHIAHEIPERAALIKCKQFTPKGPQEFDRYYCGCRGWD